MATKQGQTAKSWKDIRCWEEVLEIKDLRSLVDIVRELQLDAKGLKTMDDFHKLILDHWKATRGDFVLNGDEIRIGLGKGLKAQTPVQQTLLEKYHKGENAFDCFDQDVQQSVEKSSPEAESMEITRNVNQLMVTNIRKSIKDRTILESVSFTVSCGQMFAILGPTGSGKSTLLNIITGRLKCDSGSITVDGKPVDKGLRRRFGYVMQNDVFFKNLTLWQTLYFTAQIQLPEYLSKEEKMNKLNFVVQAMDLTECLHTVIGDQFAGGLSGGEKKRASIACELLTDPAILFLDEPTSGLDSSTAWSIMHHLKPEAVSKNRIVVSTIHQPSSQIFHDFDKIVLITGGKTGYYGSPEDIQTHFSSLDLHCQPNYNPADFLCGYINKPYSSNRNWTDISFDTETEHSNMQITTDESAQRWQTSFSHQLRMLAWRGFIQSRGNVLNRYVLAEMITVTTCIALGSFRKGLGYKQSRDVIGLIFSTFTYWHFQICLTLLLTFPDQRPVIARERAMGSYRLSALYIAKTVSELPIAFCLSIVGFSVNFWISEIGDLNIYLKTLAAEAFFIGSMVKNPRLALTIFQSYSISSFIYGGFIIQYIPDRWQWLKFFSVYMFAIGGASKTVFMGFDPVSCNSTSPTDVFTQSACSNETVITGDVI